jgi:SAM-dependent methyltransferase
MTAPLIFDRLLVRARRRRGLGLGAATFLLDRIVEDFVERLAAVPRCFAIAVDLGTPTAALRTALSRTCGIGDFVALDPIIDAAKGLAGDHAAATPLRVVADEEALPFAPGSLDLVVSGLVLQAVNDLPGVLVQIRRALRPDGRLLAAMMGGDTLAELRQSFAAAESELEGGASPRVAPFADLRDLGALLQRADFDQPVTDTERITVRYASPFDLLHDLRRMGAANPLVERRRAPLRRATLMRAMEVYAERFADPDGKVRASFDIVWLSGWSLPAGQQQKPRPGSTRMRFGADPGTAVLGAAETWRR